LGLANPIAQLTFNDRIDVWARVTFLQNDAREESRLEVEKWCQSLTTDLICLQTLSVIDHPGFSNTNGLKDPRAESFEDLDNDIENTTPSCSDFMISGSDLASYPEYRPLSLLSHNSTEDPPYSKVELSLRVKQASQYLSAIQEAVAEKLFQYSHVMHGTHSKAIWTRSRAVIRKASNRISHYCRVYNRVRAAMVQLGADESTLNTFRLLSGGCEGKHCNFKSKHYGIVFNSALLDLGNEREGSRINPGCDV
jgi:hypothetical protein